MEDEIQQLRQENIMLHEINDQHRELNEELRKEIKRLKEKYVMLQNASDEVEDKIQERIDKAIKYINSNQWGKDYEISSCRMSLLKILKGDSDE